jgi:hypothetical protein
MLERERREDQADRLVILPTARGHSGRGDQPRFAGRIMKSPYEVLVRPTALSLAAILLTTVLVAEAYSHATALHIRDPEDLALAFLLPTIFIAVFFGSTLAVASSFASGLAALPRANFRRIPKTFFRPRAQASQMNQSVSDSLVKPQRLGAGPDKSLAGGNRAWAR